MTRLVVARALVLAALALLQGSPARSATPLLQAPDFTLTLLDGGTLSLAGLKGKPVVVNFWWSK